MDTMIPVIRWYQFPTVADFICGYHEYKFFWHP